YATCSLGIPVEQFKDLTKLLALVGDHPISMNIAYALDPEMWYGKLLQITLQAYLANKFTDKQTEVKEISNYLDTIPTQYLRLIFNKIRSVVGEDKEEAGIHGKNPELTVVFLKDIVQKLALINYNSNTLISLAKTKFVNWLNLADAYILKR